MNLLILECSPQNEGMNEAIVLKEFIKMIDMADVDDDVIVNVYKATSRNKLINYLKNKRDLDDFEYIHLSGHGDGKKCIFFTPNGFLGPKDFPECCFCDATVTFSACELGRDKFAEPFMERTGAKYFIAPKNEVDFIDSAMWYTLFYYWALYKGKMPRTAYGFAEDGTNVAKGSFQIWP